MKKKNFKKIFVVFSLCVFLLSLFSVSSFALNISGVQKGYLYHFESSLTASEPAPGSYLTVSGYYVDKTTGSMTPFTGLFYKRVTNVEPNYYSLSAILGGDNNNGKNQKRQYHIS